MDRHEIPVEFRDHLAKLRDRQINATGGVIRAKSALLDAELEARDATTAMKIGIEFTIASLQLDATQTYRLTEDCTALEVNQ